MASSREKALEAFQLLRRLQCSDENGIGECISCGRKVHVMKSDGGHYESRMNRATELEPDNVWLQCKHCNGPMGGNHIAYRNRLLSKIGPERLQRVEDMAMSNKGDAEAFRRLSAEDALTVATKKKDKEYDALAAEYRRLARELKREKCLDE